MFVKIIDVSYLVELIHATASAGTTNLIVEPDMVRGIDDERTIVIHQKGTLPFGTLGFPNTLAISKKLKALGSVNEITAEFTANSYTLKDVAKIAKSVKFPIFEFTDKTEAQNAVIEYIDSMLADDDEKSEAQTQQLYKHQQTVKQFNDRTNGVTFTVGDCSISEHIFNISTIQAPRQINDVGAFEINISRAQVEKINKMCAPYMTKYFLLTGDETGVYAHFDNGENGRFRIEICAAGDAVEFSHKYPIKHLISLIDEDKTITIGEKGLLSIVYQNFDFYILPKV